MIKILEKIIRGGSIIRFNIYNLDLDNNMEFFEPNYMKERFSQYKKIIEKRFEELKKAKTYDLNENLKQSALFDSVLANYTDICSNELSLDLEGSEANSLIIDDRPLFLSIKMEDLYKLVKKSIIENKDLIIEINFDIETKEISLQNWLVKRDKKSGREERDVRDNN